MNFIQYDFFFISIKKSSRIILCKFPMIYIFKRNIFIIWEYFLRDGCLTRLSWT